MKQFSSPWADCETYLSASSPDQPVIFFHPARLADTFHRFQSGFPGLVTYAVKANDQEEVLQTLCLAGMTSFDVASPVEMAKVRRACPEATLHYNNPVRSRAEIEIAKEFGVASWSVDDPVELNKLRDIAPESEVAVRLRLPVVGAAYNFGEKFGADPEHAIELLKQVVAMGFRPAMTFHPGTQCEDPHAWEQYIKACAEVAREAGVRLDRLNVGGGFAAHRTNEAPVPERVFEVIERAVKAEFGKEAPELVCEPGRAMVAESYSLATRVKSLRTDGRIYLNDGVYGALAEWRDISAMDRCRVVGTGGKVRNGEPLARIVYGPTCDSIDRLPERVMLPSDIEEEDYILFDGMGAYSSSIATRFNGYGNFVKVSIQ